MRQWLGETCQLAVGASSLQYEVRISIQGDSIVDMSHSSSTTSNLMRRQNIVSHEDTYLVAKGTNATLNNGRSLRTYSCHVLLASYST